MSNFRTKAREIREAGEEERGNFEPTGVPKRMYQYWLARTNSKRGKAVRDGDRRENFCHFWRVVAIWAPFMWLRKKAEAVMTHPTFVVGALILIAVAVIVAGITWSEIGQGLLFALAVVLGIAWALFGVFTGISMALDNDTQRSDYDMPPREVAKFGWIAFPTFGIGYLGVWLGRSGYAGHVGAGILIAAVLAGVVFVIATEGIVSFLIGAGIIVGGLVAFVVVVIGLGMLGDFIKGKRKIAKQKAEARALDDLKENGYPEPSEPREPGKVADFFRGLGDFLILIAQVVRVKKWKICPTVEIDTK